MKNNRIETLLAFLEQNPEDDFSLYALALEYIALDIAKAQHYFELLLNHHPDYLPTYYQIAQLYKDLEDYTQAENFLKKGIQLAQKQQNTHTLKELQRAYQQLQQEMEDF